MGLQWGCCSLFVFYKGHTTLTTTVNRLPHTLYTHPFVQKFFVVISYAVVSLVSATH